jgi:hypothetical protein
MFCRQLAHSLAYVNFDYWENLVLILITASSVKYDLLFRAGSRKGGMGC